MLYPQAFELDDHGSTPLHTAMICYPTIPIDVLEAIIKACPTAVEVRDHLGDTPLHIAITKHSHDVDGEIKLHGSKIFSALIEANPGVCYVKNKEGMAPLHVYCRYAYLDVAVLKKFISANRDALTTKTKVRRTQNFYMYI